LEVNEPIPDLEDQAGQDDSANRDAGLPADLPKNIPAEGPTTDWREAVAAKMSHYRARRRPHVPRYPSLQLPFDPPEAAKDATREKLVSASRLAVAMQDDARLSINEASANAETVLPFAPKEPESGARILEFPRPASFPPFASDELAGPVFEKPRIMEAPEILPPPPALGGMLIESTEEQGTDRRPGFEFPLQAASRARRIAAGIIDASFIGVAFAFFLYTFLHVNHALPPWRLLLGPVAA